MKRVLFVDDENEILAGLKHRMRKLRKSWDAHFANNSSDALRIIDEQFFDVVVSDMRMPQVDGAMLLTAIKSSSPSAMRVVLSGYSDLGAALRSVRVAHQFLSKPCPPEKLYAIFENLERAHGWIGSRELRRKLGGFASLPAVPRHLRALEYRLNESTVVQQRMVDVIHQDPALLAKILQLANSAFFNAAVSVTQTHVAVARIGPDLLRTLIETEASLVDEHAATSLADSLKTISDQPEEIVDWIDGLVGSNQRLVEETRVVLTLRHIGGLAMARCFSDYSAWSVMSTKDERERHRVAHPEMGGYLLCLWGLPERLVNAVAYYDRPWEAPESAQELAAVTYVIAHAMEQPGSDWSADLNHEFLAQFGWGANVGVLPRSQNMRKAG